MNMKPADRLLWLRQRIKEFSAEEEALKEGFKAGEHDTAGDFAAVVITKRTAKRFDRKAAEKELGDLSRFDVTGEQIVVRVDELARPIEA